MAAFESIALSAERPPLGRLSARPLSNLQMAGCDICGNSLRRCGTAYVGRELPNAGRHFQCPLPAKCSLIPDSLEGPTNRHFIGIRISSALELLGQNDRTTINPD